MLQKLRDPVSSLTHLAGAILAIPCTVLLIVTAAHQASARRNAFLGCLFFRYGLFLSAPAILSDFPAFFLQNKLDNGIQIRLADTCEV